MSQYRNNSKVLVFDDELEEERKLAEALNSQFPGETGFYTPPINQQQNIDSSTIIENTLIETIQDLSIISHEDQIEKNNIILQLVQDNNNNNNNNLDDNLTENLIEEVTVIIPPSIDNNNTNNVITASITEKEATIPAEEIMTSTTEIENSCNIYNNNEEKEEEDNDNEDSLIHESSNSPTTSENEDNKIIKDNEKSIDYSVLEKEEVFSEEEIEREYINEDEVENIDVIEKQEQQEIEEDLDDDIIESFDNQMVLNKENENEEIKSIEIDINNNNNSISGGGVSNNNKSCPISPLLGLNEEEYKETQLLFYQLKELLDGNTLNDEDDDIVLDNPYTPPEIESIDNILNDEISDLEIQQKSATTSPNNQSHSSQNSSPNLISNQDQQQHQSEIEKEIQHLITDSGYVIDNNSNHLSNNNYDFSNNKSNFSFIRKLSSALQSHDNTIIFAAYSQKKLTINDLVSMLKDPNKGIPVRDRYHKFQTYKQAFTGTEMVDWFINNGICINRQLAVQLGQYILDQSIIKHYYGDQPFKDGAGFFYCFIDSILLNDDRIYTIVDSMKKDNTGVKRMDRSSYLKKYKDCFLGCETVDWILSHFPDSTRKEALNLCQEIFNKGYITTANNTKDFFKDDNTFYIFRNITFSGYLGKKSKSNSDWSYKWFAIRDTQEHVLWYYDSPRDPSPTNGIRLSNAYIRECECGGGFECFEIVTHERIFCLRASSVILLKLWVEFLSFHTHAISDENLSFEQAESIIRYESLKQSEHLKIQQ